MAVSRVTVRTNIDRLVGGAGEETIIARVGEGMVSTIGSAVSHKNVLENPDHISKHILGKGLDEVITTPLNPSGTSYELRAAMRGTSEPAMKVFLQAQSKRELFSKGNVLMSRLYSILAKRIPNVAGTRDAMARPIAERATSQEVRRVNQRAPFLAPTGATGAAIADE
jgi:hypothetical protein